MKKLVLAIVAVSVFCVVGVLVSLSYFAETARENIEQDNYCENLEVLKWTSVLSKESRYLLGTLYSKGLCFDQDIFHAKELYESVYGGNKTIVAQALFHDAIQLSDYYERAKVDHDSGKVQALLLESKTMGFQPLNSDIMDLEVRGIESFFKR